MAITPLDLHLTDANILVDAANNLTRRSEDGTVQKCLLLLEMLVLSLSLQFEASDPRPIIYAVLSIAKETATVVSDMKAKRIWLIQDYRNHRN